MIPARYGSKRVKQKNLRLLNNKPLIHYVIDASKGSEILTDVYVNTENNIIGNIAIKKGIKYYKRDPSLATDDATLDQFTYDFIKGTNPDVLVMINPICPFTESIDIDNVIRFFLENNYDTVITVSEKKLQSFCNGKSINFDMNGMLPKTQDIYPVQICTWAVCVWQTKTFVESFKKVGYAVFSGKLGFYPLCFPKSIKISDEEDFLLAEKMLHCRGE
jgi:CMP-N-acetylneuraminic acid synthetase